MELNNLTISQAQSGLKKKKFSGAELVKACLKRINQVDPKIKAFITVCETEALKNPINAGPLSGIPIAVKDVFCTSGMKTTAASRVLKDFVPPYDATVMEKLKQAGVIILGKTNLDSFCHGSSTETSDFFTTKNPWNLARLPGGSSGGSAAAVTADETIAAIGTETAGSIRQPAAWCGVVGLKPTYGRVSRYGVIAMASSLDSPGPIAKTVEDAAILLNIMAGNDPKDATTLRAGVPDYLKDLNAPIKNLKIGLPKQYFPREMDSKVKQKIEEAILVLEKLGAKIIPISLLDPHYAIAVYTIIQRAEVSSNLARYDGIRFGHERDQFNEENKRRIMLGTYTLSAGYYDAYYLKAQKARTLILEDFRKAFGKVDVIVGPTSPTTALALGASQKSAMFGELQDLLLEPSSIAGLPGLSLGAGFAAGLPVGMQIIGPPLSEPLILQVGQAYQQATDWHERKPNL